jgi:hypothetical protein
MYKEIVEVVKEYILYAEGLDFKVKGRITKPKERDEYFWDINHYWGKKGVPPNNPSERTFKTVEEAESSLFSYMNGFSEAGQVTQNDRY